MRVEKVIRYRYSFSTGHWSLAHSYAIAIHSHVCCRGLPLYSLSAGFLVIASYALLDPTCAHEDEKFNPKIDLLPKGAAKRSIWEMVNSYAASLRFATQLASQPSAYRPIATQPSPASLTGLRQSWALSRST